LAFISKALGVKTQGLSTYEKEYLAILIIVAHWRPYLLHAEFIIFTDQKSLVHLNDQGLHTPWQQRVFTKLLDLQYKVLFFWCVLLSHSTSHSLPLYFITLQIDPYTCL
jgi:hypothetical protein